MFTVSLFVLQYVSQRRHGPLYIKSISNQRFIWLLIYFVTAALCAALFLCLILLELVPYHRPPSSGQWMHRNLPDGSSLTSVFSLMWFVFRSSGLKTAGGVLLLVSVTCFLALLSVNSDMIIFHYLFAGFNCVQVSPLIPSETARYVDFCPFVLTFFPRPLSSNPGSLCFLLPHCLQ